MARTMQEVRAECAQLGITPGRSIEECERRISAHMSVPLRTRAEALGPTDPVVQAAFNKAADEIVFGGEPGLINRLFVHDDRKEALKVLKERIARGDVIIVDAKGGLPEPMRPPNDAADALAYALSAQPQPSKVDGMLDRKRVRKVLNGASAAIASGAALAGHRPIPGRPTGAQNKPITKALRRKQLRTHTKRRQRAKGQMAQAGKKLRKAKQRVESQIHAMRGKFRHGHPDVLRVV